MNVLIVSPGSEIVRVLSALLGPDGCRVEPCVCLADARQLPPGFPIGALVLDADQPDGDALPLVRDLRAAGHLADTAPVIVLYERGDGAVRRRAEASGAHVMSKPASLLDLADVIRRSMADGADDRNSSHSGPAVVTPADPRAGTSAPSGVVDDGEPPLYFLPGPEAGPPPEPTPPPTRPRASLPPTDQRSPARPDTRGRRSWNMANARALTRWWVRKGTGVLRVERAGTSSWVLISRGGPVGPDGVTAVEEALVGGEVSLDACDVEEEGDRAALARLVWRAAREAVAGESVLDLVPGATGAVSGASEMPLTAATRRCLARVAGGLSVQGLARREGAPVADVALDLAALRWLGLITLREAGAPDVDPVADPPSMGAGRGASASRSIESAHDSLSVTRREHVVDPPSHIERPFVVTEAPRRRPEPAADPPTAPEGSTVERMDDPNTHATASMIPLTRLRREVDILRTADGWTVLGIPRRAPPEMIQTAAQRMKHRYRMMEKDPNAEARTLAAEIVTMIERAETELVSGRVTSAEPMFDGMMKQGMSALSGKDWARADRCFTQARQQSPDNAVAVAHLGWARFNNPDQGKEAREEDGADLVELALQFDINCAIAWNFRGEIATARGELDEARQCFSTALKLDPSMLIARRK